MYINANILYGILKEKYELRRYGHGVGDRLLSLPAFYERGEALAAGKVYIARVHDLPPSPEEPCLFVCIGRSPTNIWSSWRGEVLYVADSSADILAVFNAVQEIFEKIIVWECNMQALLEDNGDLEAMIYASIPVFENRLTVTDYDLRVLARCAVVEISGRREIRMDNSYERVPDEKTAQFQGVHQRNRKNREPFIYTEDGIDQYCINLFLRDEYVGACSLMEDYRPVRESDYILFGRFAGYIRSALTMQSQALSSQFVTLKTIFSELLQSLPVSKSDLDRALKREDKASPWICIVIRSANKGKTLPEGYLCGALEDMLPDCAALAHEGVLVAFCRLNENTNTLIDLCGILEPYLKDMNFLSGVSAPFYDVFKARSHFLQAECALETGFKQAQDKMIYKFEDYVLTYMIMHCAGQFEPEMVLPPGLQRLRNYNSVSADYWDTLRRYLDNESNASQTAKELFLHRSSLLPRLEKIKTFVDMDTPEQRLYLRMCIHICDLMESK